MIEKKKGKRHFLRGVKEAWKENYGLPQSARRCHFVKRTFSGRFRKKRNRVETAGKFPGGEKKRCAFLGKKKRRSAHVGQRATGTLAEKDQEG